MPRFITTRNVLWIILGLAFGLRLYGIHFGLPFLYDPDEPVFVNSACSILAHRDPNPHFFGHPGTLVIYALSILYAGMYGVGSVLGFFHGPQQAQQVFLENPTAFYLLGRLFIALTGVATVWLVYRVGKRMFGEIPGIWAAVFMAVNPIHVHFSKIIRTDILMTFFVLWVFWFSLEIFEKGTWKSYFWAGIACGLAWVTKYPGILSFFAITLAHFLGRARPFHAFSKWLVSGLLSLITGFVASPFLLLDFHTAFSHFIGEMHNRPLSGTGTGFLSNLLAYFQGGILWHAFSYFGVAVMILGIVVYTLRGKKEKWIWWGTTFLFYFFIASLPIIWDRWIIPVMPFLCLITGYGFFIGMDWILTRVYSKFRFLVGSIVFGLVLFHPIRIDILRGRMLSNKDTRTLAREWVLQHIPEGSSVLVEKNGPPLPVFRYRFFVVDSAGESVPAKIPRVHTAVFDPPLFLIGALKRIESILENEIEFVILSDWYDRLVQENSKSPEILTYERVMEFGKKIYEIQRTPLYNQGPTIRVYQFPVNSKSKEIRHAP